MRLLLFIFLVLSSIHIDGQVLRLTCIDKRSGDLVSNVGITMSPFPGGDTIVYQVTWNGMSDYSLDKMNLGSTLNFEFRHAIYQTANIEFHYKERKDTIRLEVLLIPMRIQLSKEVIVKSVGVPDTVFGDRKSVV